MALKQTVRDQKKILLLVISIVLFLLIVLLKPLGLEMNQAVVIGSIVAVVIWWTADIFNKIIASVVLLAVFTLFSRVNLETVYSFPLSETFYMILVTYLFSQALVNANITERLLIPVMRRVAVTPVRCIFTAIIFLVITIPVIPQPLARLIIVAGVFSNYLDKTDIAKPAKQVVMYAVFAFYAVVNMSARSADIIMNNVAAGLSGVEISDMDWIINMAVPTAGYCVLLLILFCLVFRKELAGERLAYTSDKPEKFDRREKISLAVVIITTLMWMTQSIHHLNSTVITIVSVAIFFVLKILKKEDLKSIDVTTLVFLTAAFSIGGVMKECGAAGNVFGIFKGLFPDSFSVWYVFTIVLVVMLLHMLLGSNTTTLSVVVPGLELICGDVMPAAAVMYTAVVAVSFHAVLPFHSVALMIGSSYKYYPDSYITKFGLIATPFVFIAVAVLYMNWWGFTGII